MSHSVQAAFGLFDDDSSDEEDQQTIQQETQVVDLVKELQLAKPPAAPATTSRSTTTTKRPSSTRELYPAWEDARPVYVGPIELVSGNARFGGGRGYVAAEDLEPGTLVMIERVYVPWPKNGLDQSDDAFFIEAMEAILKRPDHREIMAHLGHLHPQRLSDLPEEVLRTGRLKYSEPLEKLRQQFASHGVTHDQLLQNVFGMQCNAFASGVFLFNAIFNHECEPNCVKFTPEDSDAGVSEVRAARKIVKGEPLSISYLYPREQSRSRRQTNLRDQFGFVCTCALCVRGDSVFAPPERPADADSSISIEEVEKVVAMAEDLLKSTGNGAHVLNIALEALSDAVEVVAHDHYVLMRIHKLVADCCDEILKSRPSADVREYVTLFLRSSYELLELQKTYLNSDHMDLARTLNDVSQGIQLLLSLDAKALLEEFPEWQSFRQASVVENQYRQEYRRIKKLYE